MSVIYIGILACQSPREKQNDGKGVGRGFVQQAAGLVDACSGCWHGGGGRHERERLQEKNHQYGSLVCKVTAIHVHIEWRIQS